MRKVVIISYYELKDYFLTIKESFRNNYHWDVVNYPLYMYCYDKNSSIENYEQHFSDFLEKEKPHIVLWWFTDVKLSVFHKIKKEHPNIYFIVYNFNDPANLSVTFFNKCKIFDLIITNCKGSVPLYLIHTKNKNTFFHPLSYDPDIFRNYESEEIAVYNPKYNCDISFYCDNLFDNNSQVIKRRKLISLLDKYALDNNKKFNLYGPDFLSQISDNYIPNVPYIDMGAVFSMSKINIITHPYSDKEISTTQYEMAILGCCSEKTVVLMDNSLGVSSFYNRNGLSKSVYTYLDEKTLISELDDIFAIYESKYNFSGTSEQSLIKSMSNKAKAIALKYTWDKFTNLIYLSYINSAFDYEFYTRVYKLLAPIDVIDSTVEQNEINYISKDDSFVYFIEQSQKNILTIPYKIIVPNNFDSQNYYDVSELSNKFESIDVVEPEYIYIHWYHNGQNPDYMSRINTMGNSLSGVSMNIITSKIFDIFSAFNKIHIYHDVDKGLETISTISDKNPNLDINKALDNYINMIVSE
jgi:hypothetical protein